jgi:excisionase family DNA binding protein
MPEKLLYRISEAADAIGVSKTILYELINSGEIPVIRVRSDLRVPVEGLRTWLAKQPPGVPRRRSPKRQDRRNLG